MEFKMERPGLLEVGQEITVTEGVLPSNYSESRMSLPPLYNPSPPLPAARRYSCRPAPPGPGFYVTAEFDEPEIN